MSPSLTQARATLSKAFDELGFGAPWNVGYTRVFSTWPGNANMGLGRRSSWMDGMAAKSVMVEVKVPLSLDADAAMSHISKEITVPGFDLDVNYDPIPIEPRPEQLNLVDPSMEQVVIVKGALEDDSQDALEKNPLVLDVIPEGRIGPFGEDSDAFAL